MNKPSSIDPGLIQIPHVSSEGREAIPATCVQVQPSIEATRTLLGDSLETVNTKPGDQLLEVEGKTIVVNPGSGVFDHEPPRRHTTGYQWLHSLMMAGHLDLSTCHDAPSFRAGDPSTFTNPILPPNPLKLIEHHCPPDDK